MEFFRGFGWDLTIAKAHQRVHDAKVAGAAARAQVDWIDRLIPGRDAELDQVLSFLSIQSIRNDFCDYFYFVYKPEYARSQIRSHRLVRARKSKRPRRELPDLLGDGGRAVYYCDPIATHAKWSEGDFDNWLVYQIFHSWKALNKDEPESAIAAEPHEMEKKLFTMVDWFKAEISPLRWKDSFFPDVLGLRIERRACRLATAEPKAAHLNKGLSVQQSTDLEPIPSNPAVNSHQNTLFSKSQNDTTSPGTTAAVKSPDVTTAAPETVNPFVDKQSSPAGLVSGFSVNDMDVDGLFGPVGYEMAHVPSFNGPGPIESGVEKLSESGTGVAEPEGFEPLAPLLEHSGNPSLNNCPGTGTQSNAPTTQISNASERDRQTPLSLCIEPREQSVRATTGNAGLLSPELINRAAAQTSKQAQGHSHPTHDHESALDPPPVPRSNETLNREAAVEPNNSNEWVSLFGDGSLLQIPTLNDQAVPKYRLHHAQSAEHVTETDSLDGPKAVECDGNPQPGTFGSETVGTRPDFESAEHEGMASLISSGSPSLTPPPRSKLPEREAISGAVGTVPTAAASIEPASRRSPSTGRESNANGRIETVPEVRSAPQDTARGLAETQHASPPKSPQAEPPATDNERIETPELPDANSPHPKKRKLVESPDPPSGTPPSRAIQSTVDPADITSPALPATPASAQVKQIDSQERPRADKNTTRTEEAKRKRPAPTPAGAAAKRRSPARSKPQQDNEDSLFFPAPEDEVRERTPDFERSPSPVPERRKSARNAQRAATAKVKASAAKKPQPKRTPAKRTVAPVKKGPKRTGKPKG